MTSDRAPPVKHDYEKLVNEALEQPGELHAAYTAMHDFSFGNRMLAVMQTGRVEPIATFVKWKELGRHVKRGEKAIELIMPVFKKAKEETTENEGSVFFIARRNWFQLSQTEGADYLPVIPQFDIKQAISALGITEEPYQSMSGNSMGYAKTAEKIISISPLAFDKPKTTFHEIAHVLIHPNTVSEHSGTDMPHSVKEIEAELTSYLVKSSLGLMDNLQFSRGYIQHWLADGTKEKVRYGAVFRAVDEILKAGRIVPDIEPAPERPAPRSVQRDERLSA